MERDELDRLLARLRAEEGSDLHLKAGALPRIRVNGALRRLDDAAGLDANALARLARSIMDERTWTRFETELDVDFAYTNPQGRFRVNAFRQRGAVGFVFRAVSSVKKSFSDLGLPDAVRKLAEEPRGLVLVTGPTGSGKTTTIAAMLDHVNHTRDCHVVTIEDPIEFLHEDDRAAIDQREIGFDTTSFSAALRAALRQDPDIIFVGEMRDEETVATALSAAETGHLVLSSLHTIDSVETVNRIVDFFAPGQQHEVRVSLAGALRGTICQRLVTSADGTRRLPATEIMLVNGRIQQCITDPAKTSEITEIVRDGSYYGMQTFDQALMELLSSGAITEEVALGAASNPHDLHVLANRTGVLSNEATGL